MYIYYRSLYERRSKNILRVNSNTSPCCWITNNFYKIKGRSQGFFLIKTWYDHKDYFITAPTIFSDNWLCRTRKLSWRPQRLCTNVNISSIDRCWASWPWCCCFLALVSAPLPVTASMPLPSCSAPLPSCSATPGVKKPCSVATRIYD